MLFVFSVENILQSNKMVHEGRILFEEVNEVTELHYDVKYP